MVCRVKPGNDGVAPGPGHNIAKNNPMHRRHVLGIAHENFGVQNQRSPTSTVSPGLSDVPGGTT